MVTMPKQRLSTRVVKVSMLVAALGVLAFGITIFAIEFQAGVRDARNKLLSDVDELSTNFTKEIRRREGRVRLLTENPQALSATVQSLQSAKNPEVFFGTGVLRYDILHLGRIHAGGETPQQFDSPFTTPKESALKVVALESDAAAGAVLYEGRSMSDNQPNAIRILWNLPDLMPSHEAIPDHLCEGISITREDGTILWRAGAWSIWQDHMDHAVPIQEKESGSGAWVIATRELTVFSAPVWLHALAPKAAVRDYAWRSSRQILVRTGLLLAAGMCLVVMMAIWLRQIMRPLEQITQGVQRISEGNLETVLESTGDDEIAFLAETLNDMTHRLKVKEQSVQAHIQLLKETNDELEMLGRKLREADKLKDHFLAVLSHELRTPLTAILGYSELLIEGIYGELSEKQRETVTYVNSNGTKLLSIMEDLLDIAKIRAGTIEINAEPFSLREVLEGIHKFADNSIRSRAGVRYEQDVEPSVPDEFRSDQVKLEQILTNLLSNAVKFTDRGSVRLHVKPAGEGWVEFEVEDTGIGIAEQHLPKIFEPFVQLDAGIRRRYGGTGLGLTICRTLAEKLGGRIRVESVLARGSRFTVTLPTQYRPAAPANQEVGAGETTS